MKRAAGNLDSRDSVIKIFLCGDVMTGRGIDQVLPYPSNPVIHEPYVKNAKRYVRLAEEKNGPIPGGMTAEEIIVPLLSLKLSGV